MTVAKMFEVWHTNSNMDRKELYAQINDSEYYIRINYSVNDE